MLLETIFVRQVVKGKQNIKLLRYSLHNIVSLLLSCFTFTLYWGETRQLAETE